MKPEEVIVNIFRDFKNKSTTRPFLPLTSIVDE